MADSIEKRDNKDAEASGRPVQLDRKRPGGQPHGGQPDKGKQGREPGQKPGQRPDADR
jgi:hypothetical protein